MFGVLNLPEEEPILNFLQMEEKQTVEKNEVNCLLSKDEDNSPNVSRLCS